MASLVNPTSISFDDLCAHLLSFTPPLLPPGKSTDPGLTDQIASLYVHPCIEAALHILNSDLPSAHFLCRHMQASPQYEGMYLHGILHRIEGDYLNARAWYWDVSESEVFKHAWDDKIEAFSFIDQVQALRHRRPGAKEQKELEKESLREISAVIDFCVKKFGKDMVQDASSSWQQPGDEHKKMAQDMVTGEKGFRKF